MRTTNSPSLAFAGIQPVGTTFVTISVIADSSIIMQRVHGGEIRRMRCAYRLEKRASSRE